MRSKIDEDKLMYAEAYKLYGQWQYEKGLHLIQLLNPKPGDSVLDIGCGTGDLTYQFAEKIYPDGELIAIDKDADRIAIAEASCVKDFQKTIVWQNIGMEILPECYQNHFDLAYSNYVMHWICDQKNVIKKLYDCLKPAGKFAMQVIVGTPSLVREIVLLRGEEGEKLLDQLHYTTIEIWQELFEQSGFQIDSISEGEDYYFKNFEEFIAWWEATTNEKKYRESIGDEKMKQLSNQYKNGISIYGKETIRLLASKLSN